MGAGLPSRIGAISLQDNSRQWRRHVMGKFPDGCPSAPSLKYPIISMIKQRGVLLKGAPGEASLVGVGDRKDWEGAVTHGPVTHSVLEWRSQGRTGRKKEDRNVTVYPGRLQICFPQG